MRFSSFAKLKITFHLHFDQVDILWDETVKRVGESKTAIFFATTGEKYSFGRIDKRSNQIASYFLSETKLACKECVALYHPNRPELFITWLSFAKVGLSTALLNFNLREDALVHSLREVKAKVLVFHVDFAEHIEKVKSKLEEVGLNKFFYTGSEEDVESLQIWATNLDKNASKHSVDPLPQAMRAVNVSTLSFHFFFDFGDTYKEKREEQNWWTISCTFSLRVLLPSQRLPRSQGQGTLFMQTHSIAFVH